MTHPLLARYFAGECSDIEKDDLHRWVAESPDNRRTFEQFRAVWQATPVEAPWDVHAALAKLERGMREHPPLTLIPVERAAPEAPYVVGGSVRRRRIAWKVAAAFVLAGSAAVATALIRARPHVDVASSPPHIITTARGQSMSLRLPDGSTVMLAPGSTLQYGDDYGGRARAVTLAGQGYFKVQHDRRHPFVVRAGTMIATDLGTEFVVTAYPNDTERSVVVRAGLVGLRSVAAPADADHVIEPGQIGHLSADGEPVVATADTLQQFAWTRGELVLDDIPLGQAATRLSRWYDVDVHLASPKLAALRIDASFKDEPVADVFRLIAASLQLQVERTGRTYTFRAL